MNFVKTLLIVMFAVSLFAQTPDELLSNSNEYFESRDYSKALELLNESISLDPTFAPAMFKSAIIYLRIGEMEKAQTMFNQAIEADDQNEEYRAEFERVNEINSMMSDGKRNLNSGDLDGSFNSYEAVLNKFPFFANAAYSMGGVRIRQKQYDDAIKWFNRALEIYPGFANAEAAIATVVKNKFNDGNNLYRRGDLEGALDAYNKVIEFDSTFYQACYQIGVISTRMGDIDQAVSFYSKALEIAPTFYKGWYALGLAYNKLAEYEEALSALQKALDVDPTYQKAYSAMGEIYLSKQEFDLAIEKFRMAIDVDPTYAKAYENLGITYTKLENWTDATTQLELAVQFNAKSLNGWYHLSMAYNKLADCEKALGAARSAVEIRSNFAPAQIELGVAYYCNGKGDRNRALSALEKARNDSRWRKVAEYEIDRIKNPEKYEE